MRRKSEAGTIYHVLNRGNGRRVLFEKAGDYRAFIEILREALERYPVDLLAYCLMPNHWHLLLRPRREGALSDMMRWVTSTHARRLHAHLQDDGGGHVYQGRFKSFPVADDDHLLTVARYVESNARRAGLVRRTEEWPWGSMHARDERGAAAMPLAEWPVDRPREWRRVVNDDWDEPQLKALRDSIERNRPFGDASWVDRTARRLGLSGTTRPRGRPRKPDGNLSGRSRRRRELDRRRAG